MFLKRFLTVFCVVALVLSFSAVVWAQEDTPGKSDTENPVLFPFLNRASNTGTFLQSPRSETGNSFLREAGSELRNGLENWVDSFRTQVAMRNFIDQLFDRLHMNLSRLNWWDKFYLNDVN